MTCSIQLKKGKINVEKALEAMDFDVVKFEAELKMLADHLKPKIRKKLYGQYVTYMRGCGFKLDVRGIGKTHVAKECVACLKPEPIVEIEPEIPVKPEIEPEISYEKVAAEDSALVETQKEEVPVSVPHVDVAQTVELTTEIVAKEQPQEPVKIKTDDAFPSATAQFTFPDANLFKKLYEAMCVLVGDITWKITKDSVVMRQMDPSRVAMIDIEIKKEDFEEFSVSTPGFVAFSAEEVKKVVFAKPFKKDTRIAIKIDAVIGRITFVIKDNRIRERSFCTLEAEQEDIPTPKITFNAKYKVTTKQLTEDIADLIEISDHMTLIGTPEKLQLKAEGEVTKGETTYKRGDDNLLDIEVREDSKAVYSLTYLKDIIKPMPSLGELTIIEFATDMPIKITNLTKFGELKFFIAPRIETD